MASIHPDTHFATDHLLKGLKARTVSSGIVISVLQISLLVLNFCSVVLLARLLAPEDFGLLAMVLTVMGFFRVFSEAGLSTATVQREGITHAQVSNLFWANVVVGGVITLILALSSPLVARFYRTPQLMNVTFALSATFILTSLTVQHMALLKRQMRFKAIALIQITSTAIGIAVGIVMAWRDFGYWSLVGMQLATPMTELVMVWLVCSWRPQLPARNSGTRSLLGFGANLTVSGFLWALAKGLDGLLIGRWFGAEALGFYSRASVLLIRPMQQALAPIESIVVPMLSRLQREPERYRRTAFQVYDSLALFSFPFSAMLLALAQPLILVVLGPKWGSAAPIFAALALYALHHPMVTVAGWLLVSQGRGKDFLLMGCITSSVTALSYLMGLQYGLVGVAMSFSLSCVLIQLPVTYWVVGRSGLVSTKELWSRFFTHVPLWIIVCVATWLVRLSTEYSTHLTQLLIGIPAGLLAGVVVVWLYPPSRRVAINILDVAKEWVRNRGKGVQATQAA